MPDKRYTDFDLLIERTDTKYRARVLNSPVGPAVNDFVLPFSDDKLENFIYRISQGRRRVRTLKPIDVDASREFGAALFRAVFDNDVAICLHNSMTALEPSQSLRIRLRLSAAPELVDIPWEYLYDPSTKRFLALSVDTPLVRYLDIAGRIAPLAVKPPLNVLVMIASPTDIVQLDVEQEWQKLKSAVVDLEQKRQLQVDRLENATLEALQQRLRRTSYHIFHFIGHGGFDPASNDGILMLEDEQGRGKAVSGQILGTLLHDEKTLRLALLNACEGGRTAKSDPFAGVGQSLLQQGVPTVIAMQFEVTDETAITLAHAFYEALADGYPVDAALTEARKTIFARNALEWGTPVLYMSTPDGRIFDVENIDPATKAQNQLTALLAIGQAALGAQEWSKAADAFHQILTLDPTNSSATSGLARAQQGMAAVPLLAPKALPTTKVPLIRPAFGIGLGVLGLLLALLIGWLLWRNWGGPTPAISNTPTPGVAAALPTVTSESASLLPADVDHDGLTDEQESLEGTNPNARDSDNDGLSDKEEINAGTKPLVADTDGDGLSDGDERRWGSNAQVVDTDGDTLSDGEEVHTKHTSPINADTDSDGLNDKVDPDPGSLPTPTTPPTAMPEQAKPNTQPDAVSTAVQALQRTTQAIDYSAEAGETWSSIAAKFGMTVAALQNANPAWQECIPGINDACGKEPKAGSHLLIPGINGETDIPADSTYTVKSTDKTLFRIAVRSGYTVAALQKANPVVLADPNEIYAGMKLTIPQRSLVNNCTAIANPPLQVNSRGNICLKAGPSVSLRRSAGGEVVEPLANHVEFVVVGGPTCATHPTLQRTVLWWQVTTDSGLTGWLPDAGDTSDPVYLCLRDAASSNVQSKSTEQLQEQTVPSNPAAVTAFITYQDALNGRSFENAYAALATDFKNALCTAATSTCTLTQFAAGYETAPKEIVTLNDIANERSGASPAYWTFEANFYLEDGSRLYSRTICMILEENQWKVFGISNANAKPSSARWVPCNP